VYLRAVLQLLKANLLHVLHVPRCSSRPGPYYLLLTTYYSLLTTYYLLLTSYYLLLTPLQLAPRSIDGEALHHLRDVRAVELPVGL